VTEFVSVALRARPPWALSVRTAMPRATGSVQEVISLGPSPPPPGTCGSGLKAPGRGCRRRDLDAVRRAASITSVPAAPRWAAVVVSLTVWPYAVTSRVTRSDGQGFARPGAPRTFAKLFDEAPWHGRRRPAAEGRPSMCPPSHGSAARRLGRRALVQAREIFFRHSVPRGRGSPAAAFVRVKAHDAQRGLSPCRYPRPSPPRPRAQHAFRLGERSKSIAMSHSRPSAHGHEEPPGSTPSASCRRGRRATSSIMRSR